MTEPMTREETELTRQAVHRTRTILGTMYRDDIVAAWPKAAVISEVHRAIEELTDLTNKLAGSASRQLPPEHVNCSYMFEHGHHTWNDEDAVKYCDGHNG